MKKSLICMTILSVLVLFTGVQTTTAQEINNNNYKVKLGGNPFGIKMFCDGVMVIKTEKVKCEGKETSPAEKAGIKADDIIVAVDNHKLRSNEELSELIEKSEGRELNLTVKRDDKTFSVKLVPCKNNQGLYKAGMWVRDSAAGLGTITFYSDTLKGFCGLGHGICDKDTGIMIPLAYGEVVTAYIADVTKSENSNVGTLNGYFTDENTGIASLNCKKGIYGNFSKNDKNIEIEIAPQSQVRTGYAQIYTTVSGSTPKLYDAEILKVYKNSDETDIVIRITDKELLDVTGGIVQGMSGSPILQNNRLVGALTHVITDNVDCGYGLFADEMLEILIENCN